MTECSAAGYTLAWAAGWSGQGSLVVRAGAAGHSLAQLVAGTVAADRAAPVEADPGDPAGYTAVVDRTDFVVA